VGLGAQKGKGLLGWIKARLATKNFIKSLRTGYYGSSYFLVLNGFECRVAGSNWNKKLLKNNKI
jgi:hypothetical protein